MSHKFIYVVYISSLILTLNSNALWASEPVRKPAKPPAEMRQLQVIADGTDALMKVNIRMPALKPDDPLLPLYTELLLTHDEYKKYAGKINVHAKAALRTKEIACASEYKKDADKFAEVAQKLAEIRAKIEKIKSEPTFHTAIGATLGAYAPGVIQGIGFMCGWEYEEGKAKR